MGSSAKAGRSTHTASSRIASLDLLRSFAVLWVVANHMPFLKPTSFAARFAGWGALGVDLFFVLSGFLIASQWFAELKEGRASYSKFFLRRAFRIWPNYFFLLLLFVLTRGAQEAGLEPLWHYIFFLQNFYPVGGFGITWSLCIEEHFYLIFPILSLLAFRGGHRLSRMIFFGALVGTVFTRVALWLHLQPLTYETYYRYFYHPTFTRLDGLLFGVGIAAIYRFYPSLWSRLTRARNLWLLAALFLFGGTTLLGSRTLGQYLPSSLLPSNTPSGYGLLPTAFGGFGFDLGFACLLMAALSPSSLLQKIRIPGVHRTALLSYAMYLTHSEILEWMEHRFPIWGISTQGWVPTLLGFLGAYAGAALLYGIVEKPFLNLRDRLLEQLLPPNSPFR